MTYNIFFKYKYITKPTLTQEYLVIKALRYFNHSIKLTTKHKGGKIDSMVRMEDLFNLEPANKVRDRSKEVRYTNEPPKVMNCFSDPSMTLAASTYRYTAKSTRIFDS